METEQLIRTLAADNAHRARPVGFVLTLALLSAAPVSVAMFYAGLLLVIIGMLTSLAARAIAGRFDVSQRVI